MSSEEYRSSGASCLWHADSAPFPEDRVLWLTLAQGWFELANNTERREALQKKRQYQPLEKGLQ
jgi:hypothetical protein